MAAASDTPGTANGVHDGTSLESGADGTAKQNHGHAQDHTSTRETNTATTSQTTHEPMGSTSHGEPPSARLHTYDSSSTPKQPNMRRQNTQDDHEEHHRSIRASRFTLWETKTRYYLVSYNTAQTRFRVLKVDRLPEGYYQQQQRQQHHPATGANAPNTQHAAPKDDKDDRSTTDSALMSSKDSVGSFSQAQTNARHTEGDGVGAAKGPPTDSTSTRPAAPQQSRPQPSSSTDYWALGVTPDQAIYDRSQITELLDMISEANRTTGGLKEVGHYFGLIGFIRFTSTYYMVLISKRSVVALLGGHYIYHCDETKILPVCHPSFMASVAGRTKLLEHEEARLLHTFKQVDLGKNFYFSYTYDLTRTLQENLTGCGRGQVHPQRAQDAKHTAWGYCEKFIWNHHLLLPAFGATEKEHSDAAGTTSQHSHDWVLPLCYGFVDQAKLAVMSRTVHVTLIARRSRHFAGARFLKRGADEGGHVANDVETEQIVSEGLTTAFYTPRGGLDHHHSGDTESSTRTVAQNPRFTSYVMHRGSIPIFWTQDSTNMSPRPPIEISVVDPYFSAAAIHFDDMLARYGSPIIIMNLIKSQEKTPRESKLLNAFTECVHYLNQFLPPDKKMIYIAWDMSSASKSREQDVIETLEEMAGEILDQTRFFHSGPEPTRFGLDGKRSSVDGSGFPQQNHTSHRRREDILLQTGVARVNCVDCLDRTNAAQFVIGKAAFGHQLHAMGLIETPYIGFDCDATDMLTEMYHDLGDTIALQYGGSHLVNTMETYRKINQWTSHSRDMLEGLKRYYANSFVDADKQAAINLFLGITREPSENAGDNALSRSSAAMVRHRDARQRRSYRNWYTLDHLQAITPTPERRECLQRVIAEQSDYFWGEYYRPRLFTDLMRHHAFKMTAVHQHQPAALMSSGGAFGGMSSYGSSTSAGGSGFQMPSSPSKKAITQQQRERLRKESMTSLVPSSPSSPNLGRLAMSVASGFPRARTDSFGSSSQVAPYASSTTGGMAAGSGSAGSTDGHHMLNDSAVLVTSPFTSRVSHRRSASDGRGRQQPHHRRVSSGSAGSGGGHGRYQPRLRTISGSSTSSTVASMVNGSGTLPGVPPPNYTVNEHGTHVHEPAVVPVREASRGGTSLVEVDSANDQQRRMRSSSGYSSVDGAGLEPRALMGGVRRWMTLNNGQGSAGSALGRKEMAVPANSTPNDSHKRNSRVASNSNWLGTRESEALGSTLSEARGNAQDAASTASGGAAPAAASGNAIGGWVNPFPVQPIVGNAPTGQQQAQGPRISAESLLTKWNDPSVAEGESEEYAWWISQFAGNVKLESSLPEYDALLAASGGEGAGAADQIVLDSTHSLSPADLKLYIQSVQRSKMASAGGVGEGVGGQQAATGDGGMSAYGALTARYALQPGMKGVPEGRIRAYKTWLNVGLAGR